MTPVQWSLMVGLLAGAAPLLAAEAPAAARVGDATLKGWRDRGVDVKWLDQGSAPDWKPGELMFGAPAAGAAGIPMFDFPERLPAADFPAPEGPFAVRLTPEQFADPALKPVRAMKRLTTVHLKSSGKFTRATLAALQEIGGLVDLVVWDLSPEQAVLADLNTLPQLRALSVWTPVKDETIAAWGKLAHLTGLNLNEGRGFRGVGLKALPKLRHLSLHQANVTDEGLLALADLKDLRTLDLSFVHRATDAGLAGLAGLPRLRSLDLYDTNFGDAGLKRLPAQIAWLRLRNARGVTDAGMAEVARLTELEFLSLSQTRVSDAGLKEIGRLGKLRELDLNSTRVTDAGLPHVAGLRSLTALSLALTGVTDAGLKELPPLTELRSLDLYGTKVTADGLAAFRKALPNCKLERR